MPQILHVVGSPRGERSASADVAGAVTDAYLQRFPDAVLDTLDVWTDTLPEFDADALNAKYAGIAGLERTPAQVDAWSRLEALAQRFQVADVLLFSVPMWNFGVPYKLKHLIDLVSQKDILFTFDASGFGGLLTGKKAVVVSARGLSYASGTATPASEFDFQDAYMRRWLSFVGVTDVKSILVEQTLMGPDADEAARAEARREARAHALTL